MIVIIIIALLIGWFINEMDKAQRRTSDAIQYGRWITLESFLERLHFFLHPRLFDACLRSSLRKDKRGGDLISDVLPFGRL
jgi:hypothetical protein